MEKIEDLYKKRHRKFISVLSITLILIAVFAAIISVSFNKELHPFNSLSFWASILIIPISLLSYLLNKKGFTMLSFHLLIGLCSCCVWYIGVNKDLNLFPYAMVPILLASSVFDLPGIVLWSFINIIGVMTFGSMVPNMDPTDILYGVGTYLVICTTIILIFKVNRDKLEHDRTIYIKNNNERLLTLLNSLKDGVISTDADCKIEFANPVAEKYLHIDQQSILGKVFKNTYKSTFTKKLSKDSIIKRLENDKDGIIDGVSEFKYNGQTLIMQERIAAITDDNGKITGFIFTFRDITRETEQAKKLQEKLSESEIFLKAAIDREKRIQELKNQISANGNK